MRTFSLFLAGYELRVSMNRCTRWDELERRFKPFLSPPKGLRICPHRHHWKVQESGSAVSNEDRDGRVILPILAAGRRRLTVRHPNYNGTFDLQARTGRARVAPTYPSFSSLARGYLAAVLPLDSGLLLHAAAISPHRGGAVVFAGASGSGKTTLARHFLKHRSRPVILSDELVAIRTHPEPRAFGTPFWGDLRSSVDPERTLNNVTVPANRLVFLNKGSGNDRRPLTQGETVKLLLKCTLLHSQSKNVLTGALTTAQAMAASCPAESLNWTSLDWLIGQADSLVRGDEAARGRIRTSS